MTVDKTAVAVGGDSRLGNGTRSASIAIPDRDEESTPLPSQDAGGERVAKTHLKTPTTPAIPEPSIGTPTNSPLLLPEDSGPRLAERSPGRFELLRATTQHMRSRWKPRRYRKWQSPVLMVLFFVIGLSLSLAHCLFYSSLDAEIVGSPAQQENNLR
jgi:hypothetical protein